MNIRMTIGPEHAELRFEDGRIYIIEKRRRGEYIVLKWYDDEMKYKQEWMDRGDDIKPVIQKLIDVVKL